MISNSSKVPFYYQLYQILRHKITDGVWQPEEMLPTETELVEQFDLSRSTVRQALDLLVNDGLIYRRRGKGTFVSPDLIEQRLTRIISFTEDMRQRGLAPGTRVLSSDLVPATEDAAQALNVDVGEELASVVRLRLADREPMSVEHSLLVHRYCPGIIQQDFASNSLRQMLAQEYGIRLNYATQKIRAISASATLAKSLSVDPNDALLYIERVSYSDRNIPIEFLRIHHRGDRYTLYTELRD